MDLETNLMEQYAEFLDEKGTQIIDLCTYLERMMDIARQCMDQVSGLNATKRLLDDLENIKRLVPISDEASKRLVRAKKLIEDATHIFDRR